MHDDELALPGRVQHPTKLLILDGKTLDGTLFRPIDRSRSVMAFETRVAVRSAAEAKANTLLAQAHAHRELSVSLAHDDA